MKDLVTERDGERNDWKDIKASKEKRSEMALEDAVWKENDSPDTIVQSGLIVSHKNDFSPVS